MKERVDKLLVQQGLADSRTKAQAMIMAGVVIAGERRIEKASETLLTDTILRIKAGSEQSRYVGRGGLKLEAALTAFSIDAHGANCVDIGSSTGGFTDCLLQHGAARVVCIDSGTNQLDYRLRMDERVDVRENTNARALTKQDFAAPFDLAVMDVSFISATKLLAVIYSLLRHGGRAIVLIKPQFEVGRGEVGKGGIVRDNAKHDRVVAEVNEFAASVGFEVLGTIDSPIFGAEGNKEFLSLYGK